MPYPAIAIGSKWRNRARPNFVLTVVDIEGDHIQFESDSEYVTQDIHLISRSTLLDRYDILEDADA